MVTMRPPNLNEDEGCHVPTYLTYPPPLLQPSGPSLHQPQRSPSINSPDEGDFHRTRSSSETQYRHSPSPHILPTNLPPPLDRPNHSPLQPRYSTICPSPLCQSSILSPGPVSTSKWLNSPHPSTSLSEASTCPSTPIPSGPSCPGSPSRSSVLPLNVQLLWKVVLFLMIFVIVSEWCLVNQLDISGFAPSPASWHLQRIVSSEKHSKELTETGAESDPLRGTGEAQENAPVLKNAVKSKVRADTQTLDPKQKDTPNLENRHRVEKETLRGENAEPEVKKADGSVFLHGSGTGGSDGLLSKKVKEAFPTEKVVVDPVKKFVGAGTDEATSKHGSMRKAGEGRKGETTKDISSVETKATPVIFHEPSAKLKGLIYAQDREENASIKDSVEETFPFGSPIEVTSEQHEGKEVLEFVDVLGAGGQGTVIYGLNRSNNNEEVAVKIFSRKSKGEESDNETFERRKKLELGILNIVPDNTSWKDFSDAKHIVLPQAVVQPVVAFKPPEDGDKSYSKTWIIFPVFAGDVSRLELPWTASRDVKLELTHQMFLSILNLHDGGLVHADIKMQNFFARSDGCIFVGDFSLAKKIGTESGANEGTLRFLPPEHMKAKLKKERVHVSDKKDVWSLGVVFFRMWCQKKYPYRVKTDDSRRRVIDKIAQANDSYLDVEICTDAPPPVKDLMAYMLRTNPKHRPSLRQLYENHVFFKLHWPVEIDMSDDGSLPSASTTDYEDSNEVPPDREHHSNYTRKERMNRLSDGMAGEEIDEAHNDNHDSLYRDTGSGYRMRDGL
eukprot:GHVQ01028662.1.p1 GENE.GHVQ01028662.1~~GHVQ01028662.1.p1  ORF type:complete len:785 (-),score=96.59 GHVQ01028662.1:398-2752(-)